VEGAEEENLTVADKAKKVKKAMEEYKALDHEDMVSPSPFLHELY
jgi:protein KRI1